VSRDFATAVPKTLLQPRWLEVAKPPRVFARRAFDAAGATDIWDEDDDTCHLNGTARMGDDPRRSG